MPLSTPLQSGLDTLLNPNRTPSLIENALKKGGGSRRKYGKRWKRHGRKTYIDR
jgi:hypothetical protein